ncbi:hypothetical protein ACFL27_26060, partial [candidate division CSSED10-310 bacterium]
RELQRERFFVTLGTQRNTSLMKGLRDNQGLSFQSSQYLGRCPRLTSRALLVLLFFSKRTAGSVSFLSFLLHFSEMSKH